MDLKKTRTLYEMTLVTVAVLAICAGIIMMACKVITIPKIPAPSESINLYSECHRLAKLAENENTNNQR